MRFNPFSLALTMLLGASCAMALELGEVKVLSRLGEPFKAEIQLLETASDARLGAECFKVSPDDNANSGVPALAKSRVTLVRDAGKSRLLIVSDQLINEPAAQFNLRVVCGPLQYRSYLALMDPASSFAARPAAKQKAAGPEWQCAEGESAHAIAAAVFPNNSVTQRRFLNALLAANPELELGTNGEKRLAAGTLLRLPETLHSLPGKLTKPAFAEVRPSVASPATALSTFSGRQQPKTAIAQAVPNTALPPPLAIETLPLAEKIQAIEAEVAPNNLANPKVDRAAPVDLPLPTTTAATPPTGTVRPNVIPKAPPLPEPEVKHGDGVTDFLLDLLAQWWLELLAVLSLIVLLLLWRSLKLRSARSWMLTDQAAYKIVQRDPMSIIEEDARIAAKTSLSPARQNLDSVPPDTDVVLEEGRAWPEQTAGPLAIKEEREFNPVMELAEIMLSFGRVKGAAQALQEYIEKNPDEALQPWMKLLEVYRHGDMREEFASVSEKLKLHFNVAPADWDSMAERVAQPGAPIDEETASIELLLTHLPNIARMSRIRDEVTRTWDSPEGFNYLNSLLRDNRAGERQGFPLATVSELLYLIDILEKRLSHLPR
jgi:hypothetical protein